MPKNKYGGVFEPCICYWEKPVEKLPIVKKASRNNMYILPDDTMWVLSHTGDKYVEVGGGGGSKPTLLKNTDGYLVIDGSGTYLVDIDLDEDKLIELISKQLPFDKVGEGLQIDENSTLKVVLSPDDIGAQQKLAAGSGIVIDDIDPDNPIISTENYVIIRPNGTDGISIADGKTASSSDNSFSFGPPGSANPKATVILRREGGMLNVVTLQPYLTTGNGIKIDVTNPKAPVISVDGGRYIELSEVPIIAQDWNTLKTPGIFAVENATGANRPSVASNTWGTLMVIRHVTRTSQVVQTFQSGKGMAWRRFDGSTWGAWNVVNTGGGIFNKRFPLNLGDGFLNVKQKNGIVELQLLCSNAVYEPNMKIYDNSEIDAVLSKIFKSFRLEEMNVSDMNTKENVRLNALVEFSPSKISFISPSEVKFSDTTGMVTFTMIPENEL